MAESAELSYDATKKEARYQPLTAGHRKPDTESCPAPKLALLKF